MLNVMEKHQQKQVKDSHLFNCSKGENHGRKISKNTYYSYLKKSRKVLSNEVFMWRMFAKCNSKRLVPYMERQIIGLVLPTTNNVS